MEAIEIRIPKDERVWEERAQDGRTQYLITSKAKDRDYYFLYSVELHECKCKVCNNIWELIIEPDAPTYPIVCAACGGRKTEDIYNATKLGKSREPTGLGKYMPAN